MPTVLTPAAAAFDPFSSAALALLIGALLLLGAIHPLALLAARGAETFARLLPRRGAGAMVRSVDGSPTNALGSGSLLYGEALAPGYLAFALSLWTAYGAGSHGLFTWLAQGGGSGLDLRFTALAIALLFALTGLTNQLRASWSTLAGTRAAAWANRLAFLAFAAGVAQSGFDIEWSLGILACALLARLVATLCTRGVQIFGVGAVIWTPLMVLAAITANAAAAVLGPILRMVIFVVERPRVAGKSAGMPRTWSLARQGAAVPECFAIDAIPGMLKPR